MSKSRLLFVLKYNIWLCFRNWEDLVAVGLCSHIPTISPNRVVAAPLEGVTACHSFHSSLFHPKPVSVTIHLQACGGVSLTVKKSELGFCTCFSIESGKMKDGSRRIFQEKWEQAYFFVEVKNSPVCLICNQTLSVSKEYNLRRHYETNHSKYLDRYREKMRDEKLNELKKGLNFLQHVSSNANKLRDAAAKCSYVISEKIAPGIKTIYRWRV